MMMRDGNDTRWCFDAVGKNAMRSRRAFAWFRINSQNPKLRPLLMVTYPGLVLP